MKLLFVCLGNICRSPAAESIMNKLLKERGLDNNWHCESAGTSGYHEGAPPDIRMQESGIQRGLEFLTTSRPLTEEDLRDFNWILVMDERNYIDARDLDPAGEFHGKIKKITEFCRKFKGADHIPDPYYGGQQGFEKVLDLLEDACEGLLEHLTAGSS